MKSFLRKMIWKISGKSKFVRVIYIYAMKYKFSLNNIREDLKEAIELFSPNKKNDTKKMLSDMYNYGVDFEEYFLFKFDLIDKEKKHSYLTSFNRLYYYYQLNDLKYNSLFTNKYETYLHYKKYYKRDIIMIAKEQDNYNEFESFINKNPSFIWKPLSESSGNGIKIYNINEFTSSYRLYSILKNENGIIEELIVQSDELGEFHPKSVNTLRIPQIITNSGGVQILYPVLRVGQSDNIVDNAGQGGIFASIDQETGVITSDGFDYLGNSYVFHPTTNVKFKDFVIPKWNELVEIVKSLSKINPDVRYVGWDFSLTNEGWVLVEANYEASFRITQIANMKGLKRDLIKLI